MIEADLQRHYGVDLLDLWRGTLTLRRLRVLLTELPADSRTTYTLAGAEVSHLSRWELTNLLLGRLVDEVGCFRWQWEGAHATKRSQHRRQPTSVLPQATQLAAPEPLRLVPAGHLGGFINNDEEVTDRGD